MRLTIITPTGILESEQIEWLSVEHMLRTIEPDHRPAFILTGDDSFIQCAGSWDRLTVEFRYGTGHEFRHFVVGRKLESMTRVNPNTRTFLYCHIGPISVQENEVPDLEDAIVLFHSYFTGASTPEKYALRDDTSRFVRQ